MTQLSSIAGAGNQIAQNFNPSSIATATPSGFQGVRKNEISDAIDFFNKNIDVDVFDSASGDRSYRLTRDVDEKTGVLVYGIETTIRDPLGKMPDRFSFQQVYFRDNEIYLDPLPIKGVPADVNLGEVAKN